MAMSPGSELRRRREALGWTLDQVAQRLAVGADVLRALEEGQLHRLPPGPYADGHLRAYRRELERAEVTGPPTVPSWEGERASGPRSLPTPMGEDGPASEPVITVHEPAPQAERGVPLSVVRGIAAVTTLTALVVLCVQAVSLYRDVVGRPATDPGYVEVTVELRRTAWLRVEVDGRLVAHREVAGGKVLRWRGASQISVDVPSADAVRLKMGDEPVAPRGRLDVPRRVTFLRGAGT